MQQLIKTCEVCGQRFEVDRRVGERQRVCKQLACQQQRKRRAQAKWLAANHGYFKGRYPYLKTWLAAHPGYLKQYRQRKKKPSRAIQDELTPYKNNMAKPVAREIDDIQDEITVKITMCKVDFKTLVLPDIQDKLRSYKSFA